MRKAIPSVLKKKTTQEKAHLALDRAVDRRYRCGGFASERERAEHLFMLFEKMQAPLAPKMQGKRRPQRKAR